MPARATRALTGSGMRSVPFSNCAARAYNKVILDTGFPTYPTKSGARV